MNPNEPNDFHPPQAGKSDLFDLDEHVAAMLVALAPLALSFIGHISYAAWVLPLVACFVEKRSGFVRLCAGQSLAVSLLMTACGLSSRLLELMRVRLEDTILFAMPISIMGMVLSALQLFCLVFLILLAYNAYHRKVLEFPVITRTVKSLMHYQ